jgi:hypothetical protein
MQETSAAPESPGVSPKTYGCLLIHTASGQRTTTASSDYLQLGHKIQRLYSLYTVCAARGARSVQHIESRMGLQFATKALSRTYTVLICS